LRKRWLSLLLALVMLASVTVTTASADTVNLLDKTVTLSVTPSQSAICVGSTGDVYVKYTISIEADAPIPAFQFRLPASDEKLAKQVKLKDSDWYYWFNIDALKQKEGKGGGGGPYNEAGYAPDTGFVGVGGSDDGKGLTSVTVMTTVAKFEKNSITNSTTYDLHSTITDFVAGGAKDDGGVNTANPFGKCTVAGAAVTVNPGATVSGTVKDSSGKAVSGATVELYKDGNKVGDATAGTDGKYTISNVSTGTYTLKAKSSDGSLNGSASVTVAAGSISNADVAVAKGFTVSGTIKSYGSASEAVTVTLTKQGETTPTLTDTLTGASGSVPYSQNYSFPAVPAGDYTLKVEKKGHVTREYAIAVASDPVMQDVKICLLGDVDGNGSVNMVDYIKVRQHAQSVSFLTDYALACADVNGDGNVNMVDYIKVRQHAQNIALLW
jgi:hypothetical protein